jgi:hypothetical protein
MNFGGCLLLLCVLFGSRGALAQVGLPNGQPAGTLNKPQKDTSKTNTGQWRDEAAIVSYEKLNSARVYTPDTSIHTFHRQLFTQPWYRDLGNHGSPATSLLFTPEYRVGPTLGYHVNDIYRYNVDSLGFYNTNRPYSVFKYFLGSRLEQSAGIMHTQNIRPNWNFAVEYRKITSPGFYQIQRNNHDNASLTTNYKSMNKHYALYGAMAYNKEQHDENGGVTESDLSNTVQYSDRRTIHVPYQSDYSSSGIRSSVSNVQRDFTLLLQHSYTWGNTDTTYNEDSTQYSYKLKPLFSISHKMEISTEKHTYNDLTPDSLRYVTLFNRNFSSNGSGHYFAGGDSVLAQQKWFWIDNKVLLNGFIGKEGRQLSFSAGLGNRYDQFTSQPVSNLIQDSLPKQVYSLGWDRSSIVSNYFTGQIKKEALSPGQWEYGASTQLFLTGEDAGDFILDGSIGKELKNSSGSFVAGFRQQLDDAPYAYTNYENAYTKLFTGFEKESITTVYASLESPRLRLSGGLRNHIVTNYIYINEREQPDQYTVAFNISQAWIRKIFKLGNWYFDNELVYQQFPANAPVSIPAIMGRSQFSYEIPMFKRALKIATGIEVRYNSAYRIAGYDALLNRFFYQSSSYGNIPEASVFLNFRIKRFRAFLMGDYLQQLLNHQNTILAVATPYYVPGSSSAVMPVYAGPDFTIRFGFSWPLIN